MQSDAVLCWVDDARLASRHHAVPEELAEAAQAKDYWQWFRISKRDLVIILVLVLLVAGAAVGAVRPWRLVARKLLSSKWQVFWPRPVMMSFDKVSRGSVPTLCVIVSLNMWQCLDWYGNRIIFQNSRTFKNTLLFTFSIYWNISVNSIPLHSYCVIIGMKAGPTLLSWN